MISVLFQVPVSALNERPLRKQWSVVFPESRLEFGHEKLIPSLSSLQRVFFISRNHDCILPERGNKEICRHRCLQVSLLRIVFPRLSLNRQSLSLMRIPHAYQRRPRSDHLPMRHLPSVHPRILRRLDTHLYGLVILPLGRDVLRR